ncbi:MAG: hypothetical protein PHN42_01185 [Bacilli bacterium]|nr:hypothetical protein [Bacilli bacterium]
MEKKKDNNIDSSIKIDFIDELMQNKFIINLFRVEKINSKEITNIGDYINLSELLKLYEKSYRLGYLQYLLLKDALEHKLEKNLSDEELSDYCEKMKNNKLFYLKFITSFNLKKSSMIRENCNHKIIGYVGRRIFDLLELNLNKANENNSSISSFLTEKELEDYTTTKKLLNTYFCVYGASNYLFIKKLGIEYYLTDLEEDKFEERKKISNQKVYK